MNLLGLLLLKGILYIAVLALILAGLISFSLQVRFFGIPPIVFEGVGLTIIAFVAGNRQRKVFFVFLAPIAISAIIFDPLVWSASGVDLEHARLLSVVVNGALALGMVISYFAGSVARRKFIL